MASSVAAIAANWFFIAVPVLPYILLVVLNRAEMLRRAVDLQTRLTDKQLGDYRKVYGRPSPEEQYRRYHRTPDYLVACVLLAAATIVAGAVGLARMGVPLGFSLLLEAKLVNVPVEVVAATAGAYLWGLYEVIRRYDAGDLTPSVLHLVWLRIAIVGAVGPFVGMLFAAPGRPLCAFTIGAFPLQTILRFLRGRIDTSSVQDPAEPSTLQWVSGVNRFVRDRLDDADISSAAQLACADPVRLLLRTRLEWQFIIHLIDVAKLVTYVGAKIGELQRFGVGGAIEMAEVEDRIRDPDTQAASEAALDGIGAALGTGRGGARNLAIDLTNDPQVEFLGSLWGDPYRS